MSRTRGSVKKVSESHDVNLEDLVDPDIIEFGEANGVFDNRLEDVPLINEKNQVAVGKNKENNLKKVKNTKNKKMTREEFEVLLYEELSSRMPKKKKSSVRQCTVNNPALEDFDVEFDNNVEKETVSCDGSEQGLADFSFDKVSSINGNNLFNYQNLLEKTSLSRLFTFVANIKIQDLQIGYVLPLVRGLNWENAYFAALFLVVNVDPIVTLRVVSPNKADLNLGDEYSLTYPITNVLALNSNGLSKVSARSVKNSEQNIDFLAASSNGRRLSNQNSVRFGSNEEFQYERIVTNGGSSAIQKDAMLIIEKLLDKNKSLISKVFYMYNNIDSVPSKLSMLKKVPKFFLIDNPSGLSLENIRVLVLIVNGLKPALKPEKAESFHLSSLLKYAKDFKNTFTIKVTLDMYIEVLGAIYEDKDLFEAIFKNVVNVFTNSTRNILNAPVQSVIDLLSQILVNFSLILRNPMLESCSRSQLIDYCQKELYIDENAFLLEALTERGSFFHGNNSVKPINNQERYSHKVGRYVEDNDDYPSTKDVRSEKSQGVQQLTQKHDGGKQKNSNDKKKKTKTICWKQLSCNLKLSQNACNFGGKCNFDHSPIPNNPDEAWKATIKQKVNLMTHITDKKKFIDAINGL